MWSSTIPEPKLTEAQSSGLPSPVTSAKNTFHTGIPVNSVRVLPFSTASTLPAVQRNVTPGKAATVISFELSQENPSKSL